MPAYTSHSVGARADHAVPTTVKPAVAGWCRSGYASRGGAPKHEASGAAAHQHACGNCLAAAEALSFVAVSARTAPLRFRKFWALTQHAIRSDGAVGDEG